jgi:hypothetical protein
MQEPLNLRVFKLKSSYIRQVFKLGKKREHARRLSQLYLRKKGLSQTTFYNL